MQVENVGIVGYGQFGAFLEVLVQRFAPSLNVRVHSRRNRPDGDRFFSLEEVCQCDVVILASSIGSFAETLENVATKLGENAVLVDVATVKMYPVQKLKEQAAQSGRPFRYIATHPMFGPYSFAREGRKLEGLRVVLSDHSLDDATYGAAKDALNSLGLVVLEMSPEKHDRMLAETLFLTHYIGQVVAHGDFIRTDIDTLSFGFLMDAVESVRQDTGLFRDVFRFNPYCRSVVKRFETAEAKVAQLLVSRDTEE